MTLGPTPPGEKCAQVGADDYPEKSRIETRAFLNQLIRQFGEPPPGARFTVKSFSHDFGSYREVCVAYDENSETAGDFAFNVENNLPESWDDAARKELGLTPEVSAEICPACSESELLAVA